MAATLPEHESAASPDVLSALRGLTDARAVFDALRELGVIHKPGPPAKHPRRTLAYRIVAALLDSIDNGKSTARVVASNRLLALLDRVTASGLTEPGVRDPETDHFIRDDEPTDLDACLAVQKAYGMHTGDDDGEASAEPDDDA